MNRPFEFNGDFTKGRTSKAAKQAFKDMLEDSISVVHWEYFNVYECEVHMIIDERYAFVI